MLQSQPQYRTEQQLLATAPQRGKRDEESPDFGPVKAAKKEKNALSLSMSQPKTRAEPRASWSMHDEEEWDPRANASARSPAKAPEPVATKGYVTPPSQSRSGRGNKANELNQS